MAKTSTRHDVWPGAEFRLVPLAKAVGTLTTVSAARLAEAGAFTG